MPSREPDPDPHPSLVILPQLFGQVGFGLPILKESVNASSQGWRDEAVCPHESAMVIDRQPLSRERKSRQSVEMVPKRRLGRGPDGSEGQEKPRR